MARSSRLRILEVAVPTELTNFSQSKRRGARRDRDEALLLAFISIVPCIAQFFIAVQFPYVFGLIATAG